VMSLRVLAPWSWLVIPLDYGAGVLIDQSWCSFRVVNSNDGYYLIGNKSRNHSGRFQLWHSVLSWHGVCSSDHMLKSLG
jgi:hypothetical protein